MSQEVVTGIYLVPINNSGILSLAGRRLIAEPGLTILPPFLSIAGGDGYLYILAKNGLYTMPTLGGQR